eukprot:1151130-Pelagomonas_calceolata.AAC.1
MQVIPKTLAGRKDCAFFDPLQGPQQASQYLSGPDSQILPVHFGLLTITQGDPRGEDMRNTQQHKEHARTLASKTEPSQGCPLWAPCGCH